MNIPTKLLSILLLSSYILTSLSGCAPQPERGYLDCLGCAATVCVIGECRGVEFSAELDLSEQSGDGVRDGRLIYTAPAAVKDLTVICEGGVYAFTLGEITRSGVAAERLALPLDVVSPRGEVTEVTKSTAPDGTQLTNITQSTEMGTLFWVLDSKSGSPVTLTLRDHDGKTILKIDIKFTEKSKLQD